MTGDLYYHATAADSLQQARGVLPLLALEGSLRPEVRALALVVTRGCSPFDPLCCGAAIQAYMRRALRYVPDPPGDELIADPVFTLQHGGGDCDDLAVVFVSLARAAGLDAAFGLGSARAEFPTHVIGLVRPHPRAGGALAPWVPVEVSDPAVAAGSYPPGFDLMEVLPC